MRRILYAALLVALPAFAVDDPEGLERLRAVAEQGHTDAQYELGILYEFGFDYPDHKVNAFVWYSRAAAGGNRAAAARRDLLEPRLAPAERQRAKARLRRARSPGADPAGG